MVRGGKHLYQDEKLIMNGREVFKFAVRQMGAIRSKRYRKSGSNDRGCRLSYSTSGKYSNNGSIACATWFAIRENVENGS